VSLDTWDPNKGASTVEALLDTVAPWLGEADGVTVSGGEPFDQPAALNAALTGIRKAFDGDILVYSGYPLERLDLSAYAGLIDALISDPFDRNVAQSLPLRGSDNQRLSCLTEKGFARFSEWKAERPGSAPALDVMFDDESGEVFFVGIPRPGDMRRFAEILENMGHTVATTEDVRVLV
jgi:anaerobic ribonucleoside-triphosphate reductase activating protein